MIKNKTLLKRKTLETEKLKSIAHSMNLHALIRLGKSIEQINLIQENQNYNDEVANAFYNNPKIGIYNSIRKLSINEDKSLIIVISSNKGFCGEYNNVLQKKLNEIEYEHDIFIIGDKINGTNKSNMIEFNDIKKHIAIETLINEKELLYNLAEQILNSVWLGKYSNISILYNFYKNATTYETILKPIYPFDYEKQDEKVENYKDFNLTGIDIDELFLQISKQIFTNAIYYCLVNAFSVEVLQRVNITSGAKDKLDEQLEELKINKFKIRATSITNETSDINNAVLLKRKKKNE